jgi:putative transposase
MNALMELSFDQSSDENMPFLKVWVHMVWMTKGRRPALKHSIRPALFDHIIENARRKGIIVSSIGGAQEHIHLLVSLGAEQSISELVQALKDEAALWINEEQLLSAPFAWQDDYYAVSVGENDLRQVRRHIRRQDQHHHLKSFAEERYSLLNNSIGA